MDSDEDSFYPPSGPSRGLGPGNRGLDFRSGGIDKPDPAGLIKKDRGFGDRIAQYNQMDQSKDFGPGMERRGGGRPPRKEDDGPPPALNAVLRGRVVKVEDFGAFIEMDGYKRHGLIHRSQLSNYKVEKVSDVLDVNDSVFVKVVSVDTVESGRVKIGLSMKYADQSKGTDLDPTGSGYSRDADRRAGGKGGSWEPEPIRAADALRNATCRRCGAKGHIASECFSQINAPAEDEQSAGSGDDKFVMKQSKAPTYKTYDLIPSDDERELVAASTAVAERAKKKDEKRRKKELLKKVERGEKVEPGDMEEALALLKRKRKKEKKGGKDGEKEGKRRDSDKKREKRRRRDSSDDSSSDSSSDSDHHRDKKKRHGRRKSRSRSRSRSRERTDRASERSKDERGERKRERSRSYEKRDRPRSRERDRDRRRSRSRPRSPDSRFRRSPSPTPASSRFDGPRTRRPSRDRDYRR